MMRGDVLCFLLPAREEGAAQYLPLLVWAGVVGKCWPRSEKMLPGVPCTKTLCFSRSLPISLDECSLFKATNLMALQKQLTKSTMSEWGQFPNKNIHPQPQRNVQRVEQACRIHPVVLFVATHLRHCYEGQDIHKNCFWKNSRVVVPLWIVKDEVWPPVPWSWLRQGHSANPVVCHLGLTLPKLQSWHPQSRFLEPSQKGRVKLNLANKRHQMA